MQLVPRSRPATFEIAVVKPGHQLIETQPMNRLYAARGQPDVTRADRPGVHPPSIQARSLSTRLVINAVPNHGIYLIERIEPREGPTPSPITPDCASPA